MWYKAIILSIDNYYSYVVLLPYQVYTELYIRQNYLPEIIFYNLLQKCLLHLCIVFESILTVWQ